MTEVTPPPCHRCGEPYRPANGMEGELFMREFCDRCRLQDGCDIRLNSMIFEIGDAEYPDEWVYDWQGEPRCQAFLE